MAISINQFRITHLLLLTILLGFYFAVLRDQTANLVMAFICGCFFAFACGFAIRFWQRHFSTAIRVRGQLHITGYALAVLDWISVSILLVVLILIFLLAAIARYCAEAAFGIPTWTMFLNLPIGYLLCRRLLSTAKKKPPTAKSTA